jgi:hypothetical protein
MCWLTRKQGKTRKHRRELIVPESWFSMSDFDPTKLPEILLPKHLGVLLGKSEDALANDRYARRGIPFTRIGSRVYYLRKDVLASLAANRVETSAR